MDLKHVRSVKENADHFVVNHASGPFKVAKKGLSPANLKAIQAFCNGGTVAHYDDGVPDVPATGPYADDSTGGTPAGAPVDFLSPDANATGPVGGSPDDQTSTVPPAGVTGSAGDYPANTWTPQQNTLYSNVLASGGTPDQAVSAAVSIQPSQSQVAASLGQPAQATPAPAAPSAPVATQQPQAAPSPTQTPAPRAGGFSATPRPGTLPANLAPDATDKQLDADAKDARTAIASQNTDIAAANQAVADTIKSKAEATDKLVTKYQQNADALIEGLKNGKIDPNHLWNSKTQAQKASASIGMFLGSIGAAVAGIPNYAKQLFDKQVENDLDAQKANMDKSENLIKDYLQQGMSARQAQQMARADLMDGLAAQTAATSAKYATPQQQMALEQNLTKVHQQSALMRAQIAKEQTDAMYAPQEAQARITLSRAQAGLAGQQLIGAKLNNALTAKGIEQQDQVNRIMSGMGGQSSGPAGATGHPSGGWGGIKLPPGAIDLPAFGSYRDSMVQLPDGSWAHALNGKDGAQKVKDQLQAGDELQADINDMRSLSNTAGRTFPFSTNSAVAAQLMAKTRSDIMRLNGLNRFSESDNTYVINPQVPDPGGWNKEKVNAMLGGLEKLVWEKTKASVRNQTSLAKQNVPLTNPGQ